MTVVEEEMSKKLFKKKFRLDVRKFTFSNRNLAFDNHNRKTKKPFSLIGNGNC